MKNTQKHSYEKKKDDSDCQNTNQVEFLKKNIKLIKNLPENPQDFIIQEEKPQNNLNKLAEKFVVKNQKQMKQRLMHQNQENGTGMHFSTERCLKTEVDLPMRMGLKMERNENPSYPLELKWEQNQKKMSQRNTSYYPQMKRYSMNQEEMENKYPWTSSSQRMKQMGNPYHHQMENPYHHQMENPHYHQMENTHHHQMENPNHHQMENPNHHQMENPNHHQMENTHHHQMENPHHHQMENPHHQMESDYNPRFLQRNENPSRNYWRKIQENPVHSNCEKLGNFNHGYSQLNQNSSLKNCLNNNQECRNYWENEKWMNQSHNLMNQKGQCSSAKMLNRNCFSSPKWCETLVDQNCVIPNTRFFINHGLLVEPRQYLPTQLPNLHSTYLSTGLNSGLSTTPENLINLNWYLSKNLATLPSNWKGYFSSNPSLSSTVLNSSYLNNLNTGLSSGLTTLHPSLHPTLHPTLHPSLHLTLHPSLHPTLHPSLHPSLHPTLYPSLYPTQNINLQCNPNTESIGWFTGTQLIHPVTGLPFNNSFSSPLTNLGPFDRTHCSTQFTTKFWPKSCLKEVNSKCWNAKDLEYFNHLRKTNCHTGVFSNNSNTEYNLNHFNKGVNQRNCWEKENKTSSWKRNQKNCWNPESQKNCWNRNNKCHGDSSLRFNPQKISPEEYYSYMENPVELNKKCNGKVCPMRLVGMGLGNCPMVGNKYNKYMKKNYQGMGLQFNEPCDYRGLERMCKRFMKILNRVCPESFSEMSRNIHTMWEKIRYFCPEKMQFKFETEPCHYLDLERVCKRLLKVLREVCPEAHTFMSRSVDNMWEKIRILCPKKKWKKKCCHVKTTDDDLKNLEVVSKKLMKKLLKLCPEVAEFMSFSIHSMWEKIRHFCPSQRENTFEQEESFSKFEKLDKISIKLKRKLANLCPEVVNFMNKSIHSMWEKVKLCSPKEMNLLRVPKHFKNETLKTSNFPLLRKSAPNFTATCFLDNEFKKIQLEDFIGKYVVLFFYPKEFSFVRPSEILSFSQQKKEFDELNCTVLGCSIDSHTVHKKWCETPKNKAGLGKIKIALVSDINKDISSKYGVLINEGISKDVTLRGTFIIDPQGVLRNFSINDTSVDRNVDEVIRLVKSIKCDDDNNNCGGDDLKRQIHNTQETKEYFEKIND